MPNRDATSRQPPARPSSGSFGRLATAALDVVVVGAGIVGLTAALALQASGRRVAIVTADAVHETTSNVAAAVWFPTEVGPPDRVVRWGRDSLEVLTATAHDHPEAGVLLWDTLMLYREPPGRPWWTTAIDDVRDAGPDALPPGYAHGLVFTVPLAEMPVYLGWLVDRFTAAGGRMHHHRLRDLGELAGVAPVLVNGSGLGARDLVGDTTVRPLRDARRIGPSRRRSSRAVRRSSRRWPTPR